MPLVRNVNSPLFMLPNGVPLDRGQSVYLFPADWEAMKGSLSALISSGALKADPEADIGVDGPSTTSEDIQLKSPGTSSVSLGEVLGRVSSRVPNLSTRNPLPKLRRAFARVRSGTGRATILCIGDSTTFGVGAGTALGLKAKSYPSRLAEILTGMGLPSLKNGHLGTGNYTSANYPGFNPMVAMAAGWGASSIVVGGNSIGNSTTTGVLSFTPDTSVDTFVLFYARNTGLGTFTYAIDAGSTTSIDTNGAGGTVRVVIAAGSPAAHTLNIARVSGNCVIIGAYAYDSTKPAVDIINAGWGGSFSTNWVDSSSPIRARYGIPVVAPDLLIINLGINDYTPSNGPVPIDVYKANIATLIDDNKSASDVLLMAPVPSDAARQTLAIQAQYIQALYDLAREKGVPLVDMVQRWGSYAESSYFFYPSDLVHPNDLGYADEAQAVADVLLRV